MKLIEGNLFICNLCLDSVSEAKEKGNLSTSQRQATIKLIEKKDLEIRDYSKLETHFLVECRSKDNMKSSLLETKKSPTRLDIFTTKDLC